MTQVKDGAGAIDHLFAITAMDEEREIMTNPLLTPAPLIFFAMTLAFALTLLSCSITDARRR